MIVLLAIIIMTNLTFLSKNSVMNKPEYRVCLFFLLMRWAGISSVAESRGVCQASMQILVGLRKARLNGKPVVNV